MNKKGFTLIELLAVLVVLAILVALTVMTITGYVENSRRNTMNITAANIIDSVKRKQMFDTIKKFSYDVLNEDADALEKPIIDSPWGNEYEEIKVITGDKDYYICIVDKNGKGILATEDQILNDDVDVYAVESCDDMFEDKFGEEAIIESENKVGGVTKIEHGTGSNKTIEYRYTGKNPNNHITFNGQKWRIIGIFDVNDQDNNKIKTIKIIKETPLSTKMAYGNTNNWNGATLRTYLNGDYYNRINACDRTFVKQVVYYLGGPQGEPQITANEAYNIERNENYVLNDEKSGRKNPFTSVNKVGLMYLSDYGYAGNCNIMLTNYTSCTSNNWLYDSEVGYEWLLTPPSDWESSASVLSIYPAGFVKLRQFQNQHSIRPVLYISASAVVKGNGSSVFPYTLSFEAMGMNECAK